MVNEKPRELRVVAAAEDAGARVDAFPGNALREYSRFRLKGFIAVGEVVVNGAPAKPVYRLKEGDVVEASVGPPPGPRAEAAPMDVLAERPAEKCPFGEGERDTAVLHREFGVDYGVPGVERKGPLE